MIQKKPSRPRSRIDIQTLPAIKLPMPLHRSSGSLAKAFQLRKTTREISDKALEAQIISNLLWSACGVNRKTLPLGVCGRTAASASNSQEIAVYVALPEGTYLYEPLHHQLVPAAAGDLRRFAIGPGQGNAGAEAPVRLIYVADIDKLANTSGFQEPGLRDPDVQRSYYYVDTGLIRMRRPKGVTRRLVLLQTWPLIRSGEIGKVQCSCGGGIE